MDKQKEIVIEKTPNSATSEIIKRLDKENIETAFDRYNAQKPQCVHGMEGCCCKMCQWGPCRITPKSSRGVCGRDINTIVFANLIRSLSAGLSAHARHAHEVILSVISFADGKINGELKGADRVLHLAEKFSIETENRNFKDITKDVCKILLDDLGRMTNEPMKMLDTFAPEERKQRWSELGILPRSASYEVMEALHMTTLGGCSDWQTLAMHELRLALAYCYSTLFGSSFATEILYGIPKPTICEVNYGILKKDHVNILLHGHSPVMIECVLEKIMLPEIQELALSYGAKGIVLGGMCCTGTELLARYGIGTVTNILGQELVLGTGAVDAMIVDMQCVIPGVKTLADCFGTKIITTCNSNRIPGAEHYAFDAEHPEDMDESALNIAKSAVRAFAERDRSKINIPRTKTKAMAGWSFEAISEVFNGVDNLAQLLKDGKIRGIATIVGCNTPKAVYENNHVTIARALIKEGILLTTTGCCSHALLNDSLCDTASAEYASDGLKEICTQLDIPPVLAVGGCVDNTRSLRLFMAVAESCKNNLKDMPFMFIGPEP
ncbi:MAG: anaerobic carbon-monoxide dehydrogenase catalytic subunit, partial [Armatimonadota bacterium]